jgi:hypothetical protein
VTLVAAAVVPSAPLLVPAVAGGSAAADAPLREAALAAVEWLVRGGDEPVVVVGAAPATGATTGTWDWSGFGVPLRGHGGGEPLPLALALGRWFLDQCGAPTSTCVGVTPDAETAECLALGRELASSPVRLLVVGDGSACRTEKAPGHLDPRAESFDRAAERALAGGDAEALLRLDAALAAELLVSGRAAWHVLAGAAGTSCMVGDLALAQASYGVGYLVARWHLAPT